MKGIIEVVLRPCPWCKQTPDLEMPIHEDTWRWLVRCKTNACGMQPVSPHVSIRKTGKKSSNVIAEKLQKLADMWNVGNEYRATYKKIVDLGKIPC